MENDEQRTKREGCEEALSRFFTSPFHFSFRLLSAVFFLINIPDTGWLCVEIVGVPRALSDQLHRAAVAMKCQQPVCCLPLIQPEGSRHGGADGPLYLISDRKSVV